MEELPFSQGPPQFFMIAAIEKRLLKCIAFTLTQIPGSFLLKLNRFFYNNEFEHFYIYTPPLQSNELITANALSATGLTCPPSRSVRLVSCMRIPLGLIIN